MPSDKSHYQQFTPPFDIPKSWQWVKLEDIAYFGGGKTPSTDVRSYWEKGTNLWVTSKDMKSSHIRDSKMKITDCALSQMTIYAQGTLLLVTRSGILKHSLPIAILDYPATVNQDIKTISCFSSNLNKFVLWAIKAQEELILRDFHKDGTTVDSIDFDKFKSILLPIPPKDEQERIISRIELLFDYISQIEDSRDNLTKLISGTKSKILDLAMRGKLVPQDPADERAAEILRRINPKANIITDNPHSWNIPNGWCITDLKSIGKWQSGATPSKMNPNYYGKGYPWLNTGDLNDGYINTIPKEITELALNETSVKLNPAGSVLIAMYGATIGKLGILNIDATTNQACSACADCYVFNKFLFYFLKYHRPVFIEIGGGGAQPNISKEKIENTKLYLPPLNEQQRIVAKIEELYSVLDEIEASLRS